MQVSPIDIIFMFPFDDSQSTSPYIILPTAEKMAAWIAHRRYLEHPDVLLLQQGIFILLLRHLTCINIMTFALYCYIGCTVEVPSPADRRLDIQRHHTELSTDME